MNSRNYWQHAAGDGDRNYAAICLKWDVILNGPGYAGKWPDCAQKLREGTCPSRKVTDLSRFAEDIKDGDVVVLRLGTSQVLGAGIVVGKYEWLDIFGDVDGWDLQHVRRVKWLWNRLDDPKTFPIYTLKQGDTTQSLDSKEVMGWLESLRVSAEVSS